EDACLICQILDDGCSADKSNFKGVNFRKVIRTLPVQQGSAVGLPEEVSELYWNRDLTQELLFKRTVFTYDHNLVVREDVFDANNVFAYSVHRDYDEAGRLIKEINPLGQTTLHTYDVNGNRLSTTTEQRQTQFTYDCANRLVHVRKTQSNESVSSS